MGRTFKWLPPEHDLQEQLATAAEVHLEMIDGVPIHLASFAMGDCGLRVALAFFNFREKKVFG